MLILQYTGLYEFVLDILPGYLFSTLMDCSYSAFFSKLFVSKDSLVLCSSMLSNFASVFRCSQLNSQWKSFECSVAPKNSYFPAMQSSWCSIDQISTRFLFLLCISIHKHNLVQNSWGNCFVIVGFCCCIMYYLVL